MRLTEELTRRGSEQYLLHSTTMSLLPFRGYSVLQNHPLEGCRICYLAAFNTFANKNKLIFIYLAKQTSVFPLIFNLFSNVNNEKDTCRSDLPASSFLSNEQSITVPTPLNNSYHCLSQ